eukprot:scaffold164234_cov42-Cyclotella_meneghiniana.AAC.2
MAMISAKQNGDGSSAKTISLFTTTTEYLGDKSDSKNEMNSQAEIDTINKKYLQPNGDDT